MTKQTFLQGTLILIFAGVITKVLGFVNKIIVVRIIGQEGFGLFMMAFPTLILTVTLTQLGLPVAISKMVSEADALGDQKKVKRILVVSLTTVGILSFVFTTAMVLLAPILSKTVFTDDRTMYPLLAIAPIVPIVALSSVLRGYFQGRQNMKPYAFSQIIEQMVRISFAAMLATLLLPYGLHFAAAGAMIGNVLGELGSLFYMFMMFRQSKKIKVRRGFFQYLKRSRETFNDLMGVALPATGSRLIGSVTFFFEPIVIAHSLALAGVPIKLATEQYGELAGLAIPLLFLPTFITYSLSVSLVPTLSEAAARGEFQTIQHRLHQALKVAMITGGISVVITYVFAHELMDIMYDAPAVGKYVKVMAPFFFLFYFQGPLQAALQALNLAKAAMANSIFGSIVKIVAMFALASRPELGIMGAALAFMIGVILVTLLHFSTVVKSIRFSLVTDDFVRGFLCIGVTGWVAHLLSKHALPHATLLPRTITLIVIVVLIYFFFVIMLGLFKREEIIHFPFIGKTLAKFTTK